MKGDGCKDVFPEVISKILSCKCKQDCTSSSCGWGKTCLKYTDLCHCSDDCLNQSENCTEHIESAVEEDIYYDELEVWV